MLPPNGQVRWTLLAQQHSDYHGDETDNSASVGIGELEVGSTGAGVGLSDADSSSINAAGEGSDVGAF